MRLPLCCFGLFWPFLADFPGFLFPASKPTAKVTSQHKKLKDFRIWPQIWNLLPKEAFRRLFWHFLTKKGQNDKMAGAHVIVTTHWKSKRKSYLEVGSMDKKVIFGQKVPKKSQYMFLSGNKLQIWGQILKSLNFLCWEMALFLDFGAKIKKRHF